LVDPLDPFDQEDTGISKKEADPGGYQRIDTICNVSEKVYDILIAILKVGLLLSLIFLTISFLLMIYHDESNKGIVVLSLDNGNEANVSKTVLANRLQFELLRIKEIDEEPMKYGSSKSATLEQISTTPIYLEDIYHDPGTISAGGLSLNPAQTYYFMKDIVGRKSLTIEFQNFGSIISILAILHDPQSKEIFTWEERRILSKDNKSVEDLIPTMVEALAYRITFDLLKKNSSEIYPPTLKVFQDLTKGREAYLMYNATGDIDALKDSRNMTLSAVLLDPDYGESSRLLYLIGMAYLDIDHNESKRLFLNVTDPSLKAIGLAYVYSNYEKDPNHALEVLNESIKKYNSSWAWINIANNFVTKNDTTNAIRALKKAKNLGAKDESLMKSANRTEILLNQTRKKIISL
jgi:hypothetical protein